MQLLVSHQKGSWSKEVYQRVSEQKLVSVIFE